MSTSATDLTTKESRVSDIRNKIRRREEISKIRREKKKVSGDVVDKVVANGSVHVSLNPPGKARPPRCST